MDMSKNQILSDNRWRNGKPRSGQASQQKNKCKYFVLVRMAVKSVEVYASFQNLEAEKAGIPCKSGQHYST